MYCDIQRTAVIRDRHRVVMHHPRAGHIERHRRARDIRDHDVAGRWYATSEIGAAEQRGKPGPVIGTCNPSTGFSSLTTAFAASDDAWIALKRAGNSLMSVARSTRTIDT